MSRCHSPVSCALLLLLAIALPALARPALANDFKTNYDLGVALYQAQKYEESIPSFQAAYALEPKPGILFNIAQAYRKSGHLREAIQYYDKYLSVDPQIDGDTRKKVDGYLLEARTTLAALELEMKRRLAEEKALRERDQTSAQLVEPPPVVPAPQPSPPPALPTDLTPPAPTPRPIYRRWWFWTLIGGAVAAGAVAGIVVGTQRAGAAPEVPSDVPRGAITF